MSFIYSSNSPYFMDYLASCKTRDEILNDPQLCVLLNDPHLKDNMELALLARAADYGDYDAKVEFVGFFLANGPELDTDTIMHYRKKILLNYTYSRIAQEEFSDLSKVDELRVKTYGKETTESAAAKGKEDDGNCFKNPCDYLQPISAAMGMLGDSENFKTIANIFARNTKESQKEKEKAKDKDKKKDNKTGSSDSKKTSDKDKIKNSESKKDSNDDEDSPSNNIWGNIRKHVSSRIIPEFNKGYRIMLKNMGLQADELKEKVKKANMEKETQTLGDSEAEKVAENIAPAVKMNIFANMGDCARLWEQMRRLNLYDPSKNTKGPIDDADLNTSKTVQGTPKKAPATRNDTALANKSKPTQTSSAAADPFAGMTKEAIVMEYLRADFFNMETVSEAWAALAEKFGWKGYEAEMNAHIQKTGDRNPYRNANTSESSTSEGASSDGGSGGGSSENGEAPKTQESGNGAEAAPSEQPSDTPPPQPSVEERMAAKFAGL